MADTQLNQPTPASKAAQHRLLTADDLAKQPNDDARYELVKGVLRKMPPLLKGSNVRFKTSLPNL